jgi:multiple sugar transport system permease protein
MASHKTAAAYVFVAPAVVLMGLLLIAPVFIAAILSFTDYSLGADGFSWVGLKNYIDLFTRARYRQMLLTTGTYVGVVVPLSVALGLGAALLIHSLRRFGALYRTVYFLPVMAALLAMAIVWEFALHPTVGLVNQLLASGCGGWVERVLSWGWLPGVDGATAWYPTACREGFPLWLGDPDLALGTLCFVGIWQAFGFNMVLYLAGLTGVPRDLYQAAAMDGATDAWDRFRLVTWPMLGPTTVFVVTITTIRSFQVFDTVEALTQGGPAQSTYVMMYALYEKAIGQNLVGMGSAITMVFLVFVLILTILQRHFVERKVHYS